MKILFVFSGNSKKFPVSPFTQAQADSLRARGIEVDYFPVVGKGPLNYLKNVRPLRAYLKKHRYDLIHAHYSLCGWVAVLAAGRIPVVLSLMGDDAQGTFVGNNRVDFKSRYLILLTRLIQPFLAAVISKSAALEQAVWRKKISHVVPNGVQLERFQLLEKNACRAQLGLKKDKKYVLFLGNMADVNKNAALVQSAAQLLNNTQVEILTPYPVTHDQVVQYLNAADVFTLCSYGEGSPNVVKEAMSCNCPLVTTPAGDAPWVVDGVPGCHVASYDPADFAEKLRLALDYAAAHDRTRGRERILALGLDAESVALKLENIYRQALEWPPAAAAPVQMPAMTEFE